MDIRARRSSNGFSRVTLIKNPWKTTLQCLLSAAESDLLLVSPFIKLSAATDVVSHLATCDTQNTIRVQVLTNLRPESAVTGSLDLEAFVNMARALPMLELTHVPCLHAKVYVADIQMAVITSGNLTSPGIDANLEYGVALTDQTLVAEVRRDFENYARLGARISVTTLADLLAEVTELKRLFKRAEHSIRSQARRAFKEKLEATNLQVLRQRARSKTTHSILVDTILFLLAKGPLRTAELQPLVQILQPDICDDSIDRVIDGVHFGKRWKHYVRNAQQSLKRGGQIRFDGQKWHMENQAPSR